MKIFFLIVIFLILSINAIAQKEINTEFATKMNLAFQPLEKNRVPFGLLKDQAFEFTELAAYNGVVTDTNYVTPVCIKQIYNTLLSARIHANASQFIQPDVYEQRWQANRTQGVITLSGLLFNYAQFKTDAVTSGKLQLINNQFKDKYIGATWQNPYDTKLTFAIAPSVRKYKGYTFSIKIPSNLWLTNVTQTVQSIQIDANDGLGYRTTTFGQNLSVTYTTSGLKHWYYKVTLSNGQILYSHSKIIIEEGLVTTPHISGGSNLRTSQAITTSSTTPELGRKDITATLAYNGSFGSAKVVIDYASADHKIRRPLIIAEGFDQGALTNPEDEYGITNYNDFKSIVGNSQSFELQTLLKDVVDINGNIINYKQYDIIWVDWNNGTDYIKKNAYVLEEVIKWVNTEKLDNGSSQSNVVLGASMGGLIARYALKDMEDRGVPTETSLYISHDAPHQGANFPIGYQYMSRHALHQYVKSPLLLVGGEVIVPLFTDGVTPLDFLMLQNTPAARQMLINYVGTNYGITNTEHDTWQNELRLKGYPSMRKIAISNGNHCAITQNASAGSSLLSIDGNYSTGWFTDIVLTTFPGVNAGIFKSLAVLTGEAGFLVGILPGGNKIKLDFKINSLPSASTNQIYKGKITYTKKLLWLVNINVTITDKSFNSPTGTLPFDYYPGGAIETGIRNSATASGGSFWQQAFVKYKMNVTTEPSFCFIPAASAFDIGLGSVPLNNDDYLKKYNKVTPLSAPKISPFDNFTTSFQNSFTLSYEDYFQSTNEHHIYLHLRNANWLAKEIDNLPNNNDIFDCTYICSNSQILGSNNLCTSETYSALLGATFYNWTISQGANLVTLSGNGTANVTLTALPNASGEVTLSLIMGGSCGNITVGKAIWVGIPNPIFSNANGSQTGNTFNYGYNGFGNFGSFTDEINLNNSAGVENGVLGAEYVVFNPISNTYVPRGNGSTVVVTSNDAYQIDDMVYINVRGHVLGDCGWSEWGDLTLTSYAEYFNMYTVYPNPSKDIINIELADKKNQLNNESIVTGELFDIMGQSKRKVQVKNNAAIITVSGLLKGIYVLNINIAGKIEKHKIVVE